MARRSARKKRFGAQATDVDLGRMLGRRYRLGEPLGSGGVAVVHRAEDTRLARTVAVKMLDASVEENDEARGRFDREARALAGLSHPNIVGLIDFGLDREQPYLVMELLDGESLEERLRRERVIAPARAIQITRQVLSVLVYAHGRGLLHRDLKPGNVFLQRAPSAPDHVKVLDFGLSKFLHDEDAGPPLTKAGSLTGTPHYMAPEQASGQPTDGRTDLYAAAVLLYEMLAGHPPHEGETSAVLRAKILAVAPSLGAARPGEKVDPALEDFLARGLARDPDERFRDAEAMLDALDQLPPEPISSSAPPKEQSRPIAGAAESLLALHVESALREIPDAVSRIPLRLRVPMLLVPVLVVMVVSATITRSVIGSDDGDVPKTPTPADSFLLVVEEEPSAARDEDAPVAGADPWEADDVPILLRRAHESIEDTGDIDQAMLRALRTYMSDNRADPRPHLLIGHAYAGRGWRRDATVSYAQAYRLDEGVRGDPRMLENLVRIAAEPRAGRDAREMLRSIYGVAAVDAVDEALASGASSPAEARRLRTLRAELAR